MLRRLYRGFDALAKWSAYVGVALLGAGAVLQVVDILTRRSVNWTVPGMVDLTQLFVMACVFLAIPHAFMREANVGVEFATDRLPPRPLAALKALIALLGAVFMLGATWYSYLQAERQIESGDMSITIGIPIAWYWVPLLVGCGLSVVASALVALRYFAVAAGGPDVTRAPA